MFNFTIIDIINLFFIAAGIGICNLCFMQITASRHLRDIVRKYFQIFFILITVYMVTHMARELMDGIPGGGVFIALQIVTFIEVLTAGLMTHMMSMLVVNVTNRDNNTKKLELALNLLLAAHAIILVAGLFGGRMYYFDESNVYHRGGLYILSNLSPFIMLGIDVFMLIRHGKNVDKRIRIAFWIFMIAPIVAIVIQSLLYGIQFIIFATVGSAVYMFGVILQHQNKEYEKQKLESMRIESELTMASAIQADMLPNIFPAFPDRDEFDVYASMDPAKEVGGDFYDFFLVDDDHLGLVMADVSGKGVPAALFMMASKILLANNAMLGKSPAEILMDTNETICAGNREEMFVTVWLGILEISTGKLTAANAGHEYPVLKSPDGNYEIIKDKHGFVIGGMPGARYKQYELTLEPGSKLFLYTDGVPEATSAEKELFGVERMLYALNSDAGAGADPKKTLGVVRAAVDDFVKDAEQFDDLTMLCLEYKGAKEKATKKEEA